MSETEINLAPEESSPEDKLYDELECLYFDKQHAVEKPYPDEVKQAERLAKIEEEITKVQNSIGELKNL